MIRNLSSLELCTYSFVFSAIVGECVKKYANIFEIVNFIYKNIGSELCMYIEEVQIEKKYLYNALHSLRTMFSFHQLRYRIEKQNCQKFAELILFIASSQEL